MRLLATGMNLSGAAWLIGLSFTPLAPCWSVGPAQSAQAAETRDARLDFDIPAQPLHDALRRYAALTRRSTLFQSELVIGQVSAAVHGRYHPEDALKRLLAGTGLEAETSNASGTRAWVLKAESRPTDPTSRGLEVVPGGADYPALVQAGMLEALCADTLTAPGTYRSLLRVEVDASGAVSRSRLLGSTGDARRDAAVLATVRRVRFERPPPPDMPQPVTLLITPQPAGGGVSQACQGGRADG